MKGSVSVIVPFLNEAENLGAFCAYIDGIAATADYSLEVIFVDDGSTDGSLDAIAAHPFRHCASVNTIRLSKNFGSHAAIRAGISKATGDYCTYVSADMEEPADMIAIMCANMETGLDAVYIEKKSIKSSLLVRVPSRIYSALMRKYAVKNYGRGGINNIMFNRKIVDYLNANIETNSSLQLQIIDSGFKTATIEMDYKNRFRGQSKWTLSKKIKLFIDSFVAFSFMPIKAVEFVGALMAFLGVVFGIVIIINRILNTDMLPGYATMTALLLFGFGITNISLGIIAEYLWRTYDAARRRPAFIISEETTLPIIVDETNFAFSHCDRSAIQNTCY